MQTLKEIVLFLWQLPQNVIGCITLLVTGCNMKSKVIDGKEYYYFVATRFNNSWSGVSLGRFVVFSYEYVDDNSVKHEHGHQRQSLYLGWLYLFIIGIPSFFGNIWDRLFHSNWYMHEREEWYYKQPWEHWADKLGKVER